MEPNSNIPSACPVCHQPTLPEYYFCPNCGNKLKEVPLPTTTSAQLTLYAFSIILPAICFLFITRWKGIKYLKSQDLKAKQIGQAATFLLVLSTVVTIWLAVVWTKQFIKSQVDSINTDLSQYGL